MSTPNTPYGTLQVSDSLDSLLASQLSVIEYGENQAYAQIQEDLDAWNGIVNEELSQIAEISEDTTRVYGAAQSMVMQDGDEFSDPDAQKVAEGIAVSFPLRRGEVKVGFTRDWLATNSAQQLAAQYDAAKLADLQYIQRKLQSALFYPVSRPVYLPDGTTNAAAYRERLVAPQVALPLYPLLNADGKPVPIGPNGETFDPTTHTHYMASDWTAGGSTATTRDGDLQAACNNLIEHKVTGQLRIQLNYAQEAQVRALPSFVPMYDADIRVGANLTYDASGTLNPRNFNNRRIGTYRGFEVWIKPWIFPGYIMPIALGDAQGRPVVWRTRKNGLWANFALNYQDDDYKMRADIMMRDGGASVWMRHMAVILDTGHSTYTAPVGAP